MSSASVTSSKREKQNVELSQEIDSIRAMNSSLRAYLEHLRVLKKNLLTMNDNCTQLKKVNNEIIEIVNNK
ncbi:hypothetical protein HF086_004214 [Spodoptera exigua]|uniref:Uncharacterized protein n=1 Tax=Spodoptera exigua TaxID=7107 RepID=A0A922SHW1_SPOEX|nr:hypothetical protein HF086_004214 [Spodoptera exigua]